MKTKDPDSYELKLNEYWHGGAYNGGTPNPCLYLTKSLPAARSYVELAKSRGVSGAALKLVRVNLRRGAIPTNAVRAAQEVGIDNSGNTDASMFDAELHGPAKVRELVSKLVADNFDHTVLDDAMYGNRQREFRATIAFRSTYPQLVQTFEGASLRMKSLPQVVANTKTRLFEVLGAMANQAQAKRFLQNIGLHPTKIARSEDDYVSWNIAKDGQEQDVVNMISESLGRTGKKVAKDYGPPVKRITKTIRWLWEVPGKGIVVYYPPLSRVAFMNRIEDDPGEE